MKPVQLKKWKMSYYYSDSGMEGRADEYPERIIEAPSRDMAIYIYHLTFRCDPEAVKQDILNKRINSFTLSSFATFQESEEYVKTWGLRIKEL